MRCRVTKKPLAPLPKRTQRPRHSPGEEADKLVRAYGSAERAHRATKSGVRNMRPLYGLSGYVAEPLYGELVGYVSAGRTISVPYHEWLGDVEAALFRMMGKEALGGD